MRPIYIWQHQEWPNLVWDEHKITNLLAEVRNLQGQLVGMMRVLGFDVQNATSLDVLTEDVVKSCEIEGVLLDSERVRSSVARRLGLPSEGLPEPDHYTEGVVQVMVDAVRNADKELTEDTLFDWHAALFPTGRSGAYKITVANWRQGDEPMQVVSGAMGHERVHYEAPPSAEVPGMMRDYLAWFNDENTGLDPILKAAIAHLWFVAIHPFDDGNGRLARTLTDMLMTRADGMPHRFYSMSAAICRIRKKYYAALEATTVGNTEVTTWMEWFLTTLRMALEDAIEATSRSIRKTQFWQAHRGVAMNERQVKMVNLLWDGFDGNLTNAKWAKITKTSPSTALRDIQELVAQGVLRVSDSGGRSTHYVLNDKS
ncbi:MAG: Fic family protein [Bacteroidales bacterium]|nr:Fic family protein [Candidatus Colimorpha pelethequi]